MIVTVVAIFDEFNPHGPLAKVLKERLVRLASELQDENLKALTQLPPMDGDIVVYLSYNLKYTVRWRIANDVPDYIEKQVAELCAQKGYIVWKTSTVNIFKGSK